MELPSLLTPDEIVIGNWISARLERQRQGNETPSAAKTPKTRFMKKQENVAILSKQHKLLCKENTDIAKQTFEDLYIGVVLEVPVESDTDANQDDEDDEDMSALSTTEVRIVTSVFYQEHDRGVKSGWHVATDIACELEDCMHSQQKYSSSDVNDVRNMKIESGSTRKPGLGTYIKLFNTNEKDRWILDVDD